MSALIREVTKSITAQNQFTDWMPAPGGIGFDVSVNFDAPGAGTITLQRRRTSTDTDHHNVPRDVETYTANTEKVSANAGGCEVRLICKTGDYGSGTIETLLHVGSKA